MYVKAVSTVWRSWSKDQERWLSHHANKNRLTTKDSVWKWFGTGVWVYSEYRGTFHYNKGPRDWQNVSAIKKFHYIEVLFYIFYYCWGEENCSLYQRVCYVEVCSIEKVSWWQEKMKPQDFFYRVSAKNWGFSIQSSLKSGVGGFVSHLREVLHP